MSRAPMSHRVAARGRAPIHALLLWGASFYLATHGVLPPAASETEARELAVALREASVAWAGARVEAARALAARLLAMAS